jgi:hypothetical protein
MHRKLLALAAAVLVLGAPSARALDWSDNALRYTWGPSFSEPGVSKAGDGSRSIAKSILAFTHVDGYFLGGNYLNVNMLLSTSEDPTRAGSGEGATEVYAIYRHDLSLNKITKNKGTYAFGAIRDLYLEAGIDLSTKNTTFAPHKVMPVVGPVIALNVPGFWNVGVLANKEWNNNGIVNQQVEFDPTVMFSTAWAVPVPFVSGIAFEGFGSVNLPKGKDGFGNKTATEVLLHPKIMYDVGGLFAKKGYQVGVGYEYWLNKFGNDASRPTQFGAEQSTFLVEASLHL